VCAFVAAKTPFALVIIFSYIDVFGFCRMGLCKLFADSPVVLGAPWLVLFFCENFGVKMLYCSILSLKMTQMYALTMGINSVFVIFLVIYWF